MIIYNKIRRVYVNYYRISIGPGRVQCWDCGREMECYGEENQARAENQRRR